MQAEQLQYAFRVSRKRFKFVIRLFRCCYFDQLYLVELMHAENATGFAASCASFAPETWRIANEFRGNIGYADNYIAMKVRELNLCSWCKKHLVLLQTVHVRFKFGQLRRADHTIAPNQKRRTDFGVTMLTRVQIDHEIDQRALQPRAGTGENDKTAAAQFGRASHVQEI